MSAPTVNELTASDWFGLVAAIGTFIAAIATVFAAFAARDAAKASEASVDLATKDRQEERRLREIDRRIEILRVTSALKSSIENQSMPQYRAEMFRRTDELFALLAGTDYDIPAVERFVEGENELGQDAVNQAIALVRQAREQ